LDDLDCLKDEPAIQAELFSIFAYMKFHGKQVVLTSVKTPESLEGFEQTFANFLKTEGKAFLMSAPDQDALLEILKSKAQQKGEQLEDGHARQIVAYSLDQKWNVRQLEGALNVVIERLRHDGRPISSSLITEALGSGAA
jgi:chromosomal replication initiator protein